MTEVNFPMRQAELQQHIAAAEADHETVAYKFELGEATDDDLKRSRDNLATLRDRLGGVEKAQERSRAEDQAEARRSAARRREMVTDLVEVYLQERSAAIEELYRLASDLETAGKRLVDADEAIIRTVHPLVARDRRTIDIRTDIVPSLDRDRALGAQTLLTEYPAVIGPNPSIIDHCERTNIAIRAGVQSLIQIASDEDLSADLGA